MARVTGLEPATSGVTGRHSNQLSYTRAFFKDNGSRGAAFRGALIRSPLGAVNTIEGSYSEFSGGSRSCLYRRLAGA